MLPDLHYIKEGEMYVCIRKIIAHAETKQN